MIGTVCFLLLDVILVGIDVSNANSVANFGRVWMLAGSQASMETPFGDSFMTYFPLAIKEVFANFGKVITVGSDFSAYSGNTVLFLVSGVLVYFMLGMYTAEGSILASKKNVLSDSKDMDSQQLLYEKGMKKSLVYNSLTNLIAPFFGVGNVMIGGASVSGSEDNGKSGLVSIVASIGFLLSAFVVIVPVFFVTKSYPVTSMNQWNYNAFGNSGFVYLMDGAVFFIINTMMVLIGLTMVLLLKEVNFKKITEFIPVIATVIISVLFMNVVFGVLLGIILYIVICMIVKREESKDDEMEISFRGVNLCNVLLLIGLLIAILL